jgi:uncharacterized membrane protein
MNRDGFPIVPRGGFRDGFVEVGGGGGWPDALAWAIFALLVALVLVAIVSLALDAYYRSQRPKPFVKAFPPGMTPSVLPGGALAVLGARYARGEISRAEYFQVRDDLTGVPDEVAEAPTEVVPPSEPPAEPGKKD